MSGVRLSRRLPGEVIPDNIKTGVTDANYWDPVLNRSYRALCSPLRHRHSPGTGEKATGQTGRGKCGQAGRDVGAGAAAPPSVLLAGRGQRRARREDRGVQQPAVGAAARGQPALAVRGDRARASSSRCRRSLMSSASGSWHASTSTTTSPSTATSIRCRTGWCINGSTSS